MSYGDFNMLIKFRGAKEIVRLTDEKLTQFDFEGKRWVCVDQNRRAMTDELANGYEMNYCLKQFCNQLAPQPGVTS